MFIEDFYCLVLNYGKIKTHLICKSVILENCVKITDKITRF